MAALHLSSVEGSTQRETSDPPNMTVNEIPYMRLSISSSGNIVRYTGDLSTQ